MERKCKDCGCKKETNHWSSDGWDRMCDWVCTGKNDKKIAGGVEWHDENKIMAPDWCPLIDHSREKKLDRILRKYTEEDLLKAYNAGKTGNDFQDFLNEL